MTYYMKPQEVKTDVKMKLTMTSQHKWILFILPWQNECARSLPARKSTLCLQYWNKV